MNIILFKGNVIPEYIPVADERAKHIRNILKLREGDVFKCGLVNGPSGECTIQSISDRGVFFSWEEKKKSGSLYPLTLLVGYTRPISSKRILREAASLGAGLVIFCGTDTGEKSYRKSNLWKTGEYERYLIDGSQQAGSTGVPDVLFYESVKIALEAIPPLKTQDMLVLDNVNGSVSLSEYSFKKGDVLLAIGSERGWSDLERQLFKERGFDFVHLGDRILRTETACTAGIALALSRMGYM